MPSDNSRVGQLNAVIDPKLLFLAKLAARYKGQTLIQFIESAFRLLLSREAMLNDEPNVNRPDKPKPEEPLWYEDLWDEDAAVRLYRVAMVDLNLLSPKQREIFLYVVNDLMKQGKKATLKTFVEELSEPEEGK